MPDSFPPRLGLLPSQGRGQRRFIVVDDTVYAIYGRSIEKVSWSCKSKSLERFTACLLLLLLLFQKLVSVAVAAAYICSIASVMQLFGYPVQAGSHLH